MNLLKRLFKKRKKNRYTVSDFEKAPVRGGYEHDIYEIQYNPDRSVRIVIGVVKIECRRIFVTWNSLGQAFIVRERDEKFDLVFER